MATTYKKLKYDNTECAVDVALKDGAGNTISSTYATKTEVAKKQDTLTAGDNITIKNNVISATGGSVVTTPYEFNIEHYSGYTADTNTLSFSSSGVTLANTVIAKVVNSSVISINLVINAASLSFKFSMFNATMGGTGVFKNLQLVSVNSVDTFSTFIMAEDTIVAGTSNIEKQLLSAAFNYGMTIEVTYLP